MFDVLGTAHLSRPMSNGSEPSSLSAAIRALRARTHDGNRSIHETARFEVATLGATTVTMRRRFSIPVIAARQLSFPSTFSSRAIRYLDETYKYIPIYHTVYEYIHVYRIYVQLYRQYGTTGTQYGAVR